MAECPNCGKESQGRFCPYCGSPMEGADARETGGSAMPPPQGVPPPPPPGQRPPAPPGGVAPGTGAPPGIGATPSGAEPPRATAPLLQPGQGYPAAGTYQGLPPAGTPQAGVRQPGASGAPSVGQAPPYSYSRQPAARGGSGTSRVMGALGLTGTVVAAVGSVTTWISLSGLEGASVSGWDRDGMITLFVALAAFAFFLVGLIAAARWPFAVGLVLTVIMGAVFVIDMVDIANNLSFSSVGYGLYVGIVGTVVALIAAIGGVSTRSQ